MEKLKKILDPVFAGIEGLREVAIFTNNSYNVYTFIKGDTSYIQIDFVKTLAILLQGVSEKLNEIPKIFLGEMENSSIAILFMNKLTFTLLFENSENIGYLKLQIEELKDKLNDNFKEIETRIEDAESGNKFKIPQENTIDKIIKEFSIIEV